MRGPPSPPCKFATMHLIWANQVTNGQPLSCPSRICDSHDHPLRHPHTAWRNAPIFGGGEQGQCSLLEGRVLAAPTQSGELTQTPKKNNAGPDSYPPSKVPLDQPVGGWEGAQDQIHLESHESECTNGFLMVEIGGVGTTRPLVINRLGKRKASVWCCRGQGKAPGRGQPVCCTSRHARASVGPGTLFFRISMVENGGGCTRRGWAQHLVDLRCDRNWSSRNL